MIGGFGTNVCLYSQLNKYMYMKISEYHKSVYFIHFIKAIHISVLSNIFSYKTSEESELNFI